MVEHFCILFLLRRYHLQIVLYMKLSVLKSIFGYIHLLTSPKVQSFPLLGRIRDFHPLATCAARRTLKKDAAHISAHSAKARIPIFLTQTSHFQYCCQLTYCLLCQGMLSILQSPHNDFCRQRTIAIALPHFRFW